MSKITLNLGAILSDIIKNANSNFTELFDAISAIQEKIADDGEKAVVYSSVAKMIAGLNAGTDEAGNALGITIGDEIYILDDDTPDFWVSAVSTSSSTGTAPTSWEKDTNYVFGKYTIRVSKSREIDLTDYQKISNLVTALSEDSTDTAYPSAKTVYNAIQSLKSTLEQSISGKVDTSTYNAKVANLESGISTAISTANTAVSTANTANNEINKIKDGAIVVKKAEQDASGNNIASTYATKTEVASAINQVHTHDNKGVIDKFAETEGKLTYNGNELGKVQGVALNGDEIELDADGIANIVINVADLKGDYIDVTPTSNAITVNDTTYNAIVVADDTDVTLELLNSSGQAVVTQIVRKNNKLYYCLPSGDTNTYTLRKVGGNSVGGGGSGLSSVTLYRHTIYAKTSQAVTNFNDYSDGYPTHIYLSLQRLTNGAASYTSLDTATNIYKDSYGNSNYMLPFTGYCVFATNDKEYYCPLIHAYYELGKLNLKFVNSFDGTELTYEDTDKVIGIIEDRVSSIIVNQ